MYVHCGQFGSPEKKSIITKELNKIEIWIELMRYMGETEADVTSSLGDSIWSILLSGFINCTKLHIEKKKKILSTLGNFYASDRFFLAWLILMVIRNHPCPYVNTYTFNHLLK